MPLIETKGAASAQGFGGAGAGAFGPVTYIEDVFSTYLYTGNGSTQTITNGIDLSGKGGLVWIKRRDTTQDHALIDTARANGASVGLATNSTSTGSAAAGGFLSTGFSVGNSALTNASNATFASWTFREQPKFFDIVTYTGDGANRTISHNLGSVPGCIIVKRTDAAADWQVYHRSLANTEYIVLNNTAAVATGTTRWNSTTPTSTVFSLGTDTTVNANGGTYVAYLFAHNAGGFGLSGTDNVISCGAFTTDASVNASVNLGWEPQWLTIKNTTSADDWWIVDNMRGYTANDSGNTNPLVANLPSAEFSNYPRTKPTSTGFVVPGTGLEPNKTYIYIAIRRGPMKVPTSGTSVFSPNQTSATTGTAITTGFPVDWQLVGINGGNVQNQRSSTRLTGVNTNGTSNSQYLITSNTNAEAATGSLTLNWNNTGFQVPSLNSGSPTIFWNFRRAPGFFDVVCYTGTGSAQTLSHNLGVTPELMIVKWRTGATGDNWNVYHSAIGATGALYLNNTDATVGTAWNNTAPTATQFTVGTQGSVSAATYVAYLFATCAGVSKVGSYTGTGALQTINCGFTGGARFVLIKRTDSTGDWYVYDSARGISSGNDPYLLLNSTAAEVTGTNYVDTTSVGFQVTAAAPAGLNASGGTYIFLAIA